MNGLEKTFWEENAKDILKDKGISNTEFAKRLGILPQNIRKWIETKNIANLDKIAATLGLDLIFLLYGNREENRQDINGYVEVNGTVYKIRSKEDIISLLDKLS